MAGTDISAVFYDNITVNYASRFGSVIIFSVTISNVNIVSNSTTEIPLIKGNHPKAITPLILFSAKASSTNKNDVTAALVTNGNIAFRGDTSASDQGYIVTGVYIAN